jgi:hypothetical protein
MPGQQRLLAHTLNVCAIFIFNRPSNVAGTSATSPMRVSACNNALRAA